MIDWDEIDTVFLDMDGTLLDLHFDNYFWLSHLPARYADIQGVDPEQAAKQLDNLFQANKGTLNFYCIDFWTDTLGVNIAQLKEEVKHLVAFRPHVEHFLEELKHTRHRVVVVTNSHRKGINLKLALTGLDRYVDNIVCAHEFGRPKEDVAFWSDLQWVEPFDPARTLFIDDTIRVLDAAREYGIKHLLCVLQPDSTEEKRHIPAYPAVDKFKELLTKL